MALSAGTRLGPYEILEPLGAGGMGEVYRARDPRLKRDVALKVLPEDLASEPERLERFEREAQTLAALNHPHIVTIFSVEEADEHRFLTMELVEGRTLSTVIPRGGLPLSPLLQIAIPLAEAVSAAHEKGIVHRDLKPGNVMVTEEGWVKVLDFGLAKLREGARRSADSQSPTETATGPGRILGTAPYMSPEQVQGKALDHRSDVFALGIILYEMATGERPFAGDSFADVASSILKDTPVWVTERKADLPRDLGKLIKHCLEKEPRKRFQTALDLANELEELRREVDSGEALTSGGTSVVTSRAGGKRRMWLVGGAVVVAVGLAVGSLLLSRNAQPPAAPLEITPFTADGGMKGSPQLSPDGEKVAYEWKGYIYVKALGVGTRPLRLTEPGARYPVWSPDERRIAFTRSTDEGAAIYTVPSLGGQETLLTEPVDSTGPLHSFRPSLSWSPDGEWLAWVETVAEPIRIVRLSLDTLEKEPLTSPPADSAGDHQPLYSPGEDRQVTFGKYDWLWLSSWTPDGAEIVFAVSAPDWTMFRQSLAGGEPQPVLGTGLGASGASIRGDRMVYLQWVFPPANIWRVPGRRTSIPDQPPEMLISSSRNDGNPAFSPDGRRIAFESARAGGTNIWVCESDGSNPIQLTHLEGHTGAPRWSPDGRRITFDSRKAGDANVYVIDAQGGRPHRLTQQTSEDIRPIWSRDGHWIYFASDRSGDHQIWKVPAEGGEAEQVTQGGGFYAQPSWDGRHLYYEDKPSNPGIWRVPVDGGEETEMLGAPIAGFQAWAVSESGIYYSTAQYRNREEYTIQYLEFESGQVTELFRKEGQFHHGGLAVSPGEEWVLYSEWSQWQTSELMLVENFR